LLDTSAYFSEFLTSIRYINQLFSGKYLGGVFNGSSCYFVLYIVLPSSAHNHRKFSSTAAVYHCSDDVVKNHYSYFQFSVWVCNQAWCYCSRWGQ